MHKVDIYITSKEAKKLLDAVHQRKGVQLPLRKKKTPNHTMKVPSHLVQTIQAKSVPKVTIPAEVIQQQGEGWIQSLLPFLKSVGPKVLSILPALGLSAVTGAISGATSGSAYKKTSGNGELLDLAKESQGSGIGGAVTKYVSHGFTISPNQEAALKKAITTKSPLNLRFKHSHLKGDKVIFITPRQQVKVMKSLEKGVGVILKLSKTQLTSKSQTGGFIPELIAGILGPLIGSLFTGQSGHGILPSSYLETKKKVPLSSIE